MATKKTEVQTKTGVKKAFSASKKNESKPATAKTSGSKPSSSSKTGGSKSPSTAKATGNSTSSAAAKSGSSEKLTAAEKKLLSAYRAASVEKRDAALAILENEQGEENNLLSAVLSALGGSSGQQAQTEADFFVVHGKLLSGGMLYKYLKISIF